MDLIPQEILGEIFLCCLTHERTGIYAAVSTSQAPLLFLSVCKRWRDIAVSSPVLWSSMRLNYPRRFLGASTIAANSNENVPAAVGVKAWLSRAKDQPIRLFMREDYDPQFGVAGSSGTLDASRSRTVIDISDAFGEFSATCADLEIDVSPMSFRAFCLDSQGDRRSFPALRSLSIGTSHSPWMAVWDTNTAHDLPLFSADTRLHSLSLSMSYLPVNLLRVPPTSLESLTELILTYRLETDLFRPSPLHVFQVLWHCHNLRTCTFTLGEAHEALAFEPERGRLELQSLRTLVIYDECPTTTLSLMSALYVPSLERLRYNHCIGSVFDLPYDTADEPLLPIQSLQLRLDNTGPSPMIELTLRLIADDDDDEGDISKAIYNYLIREGESIRDLVVGEASLGITELLLLTEADSNEVDDGEATPTSNNSEGVLCPDLQTIVWSSCGENTRVAFLRMLRQRCVTFPRHALQRAQLVFWELSLEGMQAIESELTEMITSVTSDLTIEYEIHWWMGAPCEGRSMSRKGIMKSMPVLIS
ncbi:hypothetical protein L218DRAFT_420831 [Marasmius fiardii PR-910]|nr:hypothetical protein L218DRAFT_420831 [Marasmius fiardii PR-910]